MKALVLVALVSASPPAAPTQDGVAFETRCNASGVVFCDSLDDDGAWWVDSAGERHVFENPEGSVGIPTESWWRRSRGVQNGCLERDLERGLSSQESRFVLPGLDRDVKASGDGSLHFTFPDRSGQGCGGNFETNLSPDLSRVFGPGDTVYIQFRIRYNCAMLYEDCEPGSPTYLEVRRNFRSNEAKTANRTFPKQFMFHGADWLEEGFLTDEWHSSRACDAFQMVLNSGWDGYLAGYHACGWYQGWWESGARVQGTVQRHFQNGFLHGAEARCDYVPDSSSAARRTMGNIGPNCWQFEPDEWATVQMRVIIGPYQQKRTRERLSRVTIWAAHEGETQSVIIDTPFDLKGRPGHFFGKIWLGTFMTEKSPAEEHDTVEAWYDELIVSTEFIDDPR